MFKKVSKISKNSFSRYYSQIFFKNIGFLGAPFYGGQLRKGTDLGPKVLREFGYVKQFQQVCQKFNDYGDLNFDQLNQLNKDEKNFKFILNSSNFLSANQILSKKVNQIANDNDISITIGGDHSLGFGSIYGHSLTRKNISVLWVDAHADLNSIQSTLTKNAHGMPGSFLINEINYKYNKDYIQELNKYQLDSCITSQDIVYIGLRDVDRKELDYLNEFKIKYFTMKHVDQMGIKKVVDLALEHLIGKNSNYLHVSFDVDAIDPIFIPSTGTKVPGGLSVREAFELAETVYQTKRLKAIDLFEINPLIGNNQEISFTLSVSFNLLMSFIGKSREVYFL